MPGQSQRQRMRDAQLANQRTARFRRIIIVGSAVLALVLVALMVVVIVQQNQKPATTAPAENGKAIPAATFTGKTGDDLKGIIEAAAKA